MPLEPGFDRLLLADGRYQVFAVRMDLLLLEYLNRQYWRVFNILARIVGLWFVLGAALMSYALFFRDQPMEWPWVIAIGLVGLCGFGILRTKAFRPDLDGHEAAFEGTPAEQCSWWTGDRTPTENMDDR